MPPQNQLSAYRICKTKYAKNAFDGEGAFRFGGRWNSRGTRIIYTAGTLSLAVLEVLAHLDDEALLDAYSYIPIKIPTPLIINVEAIARLPKNWSASPAPLANQKIGDDWVRANLSAVLEVPSSIISIEKNYLLNPAHPDFNRIAIGATERLRFDKRFVK